MKKHSLRFLLLPLLVLMLGGSGMAATEPAIIAKARAYLGSEAALNGVKTLHYYGTLTIEDADFETPISVEIILQKPYRQLSVIKSDQGSEITGLDGFEAWQRVIDGNDESRWRLSLMSIPQVKRLRANAWENLSFFRGLEKEGGRIEDLGNVKIDGMDCRKIAFIHGPQTVFTRYFDQQTGRLVLTETILGEKITEEGMIQSGGVRFPQVLVTVTPGGDGTSQTVRIEFDRVLVNESIPPETFAVPMLTSN